MSLEQAQSHNAVTAAPPATQATSASEIRLAGILDIADDAIIAINSAQRITLFNQGAERIFGYTSAEVIGQPLDILLPARFTASHARHVAAFGASSQTARRMGERSDIYGRRKDGSEFPAEASISRLKLDGEQTFTVILRDITDRKRFEEALRQKNIELERALQAKDHFLASMSHELRTPLNAILGFTGTLLMKLPGPLNADQEKQLRTVQTSARHLLSLINDLLDMARIESGKVDLTFEPISCQEVIAEVVAGLRTLAEAKGLALTLALPEPAVPVLPVLSDRRALSQILINLVNNAIKFTDQGEIRVALRQEHGGAGLRTAIGVSDTGSGISPEDQKRVFEAFRRSPSEAARRNEGTGLGLHLSQKLAHLIGAQLTFESQPGVGTTFTLMLDERQSYARSQRAESAGVSEHGTTS